MFGVTPPFWAQPPAGGGVLTPGASAIGPTALTGTIRCERLSATQTAVLYQSSSTFTAMVVVATESGGVITFGTPVAISASTGVPFGINLLDAGTGEFLCTYRSVTAVFARVITIDGAGVVTASGVEKNVAAASSPSGGTSGVLSSGQGVMNWIALNLGVAKVHTIGLSISAGVISVGVAAVSGLVSLGGRGSRVAVSSGAAIQLGPKTGGTPAYINALDLAVSGGTSTPSAPIEPINVADRIDISSTFNLGSNCGVGAGVVVGLYHSTVSGKACGFRMQVSGGAASYSNSDTNENPLDSGPYIAPAAADIQGWMTPNFSNARVLFVNKISGVIKGCVLGVSGNLNMAGDVTTLTGAANNVGPVAVYLTNFKASVVHCNASNAIVVTNVAIG